MGFRLFFILLFFLGNLRNCGVVLRPSIRMFGHISIGIFSTRTNFLYQQLVSHIVIIMEIFFIFYIVIFSFKAFTEDYLNKIRRFFYKKNRNAE